MLPIIGYLLLSYLIADFIAGFFHWWEDQYATEDMWLIGTLVSGPNSMHHAQPTAFLRGSYFYRNWTTIVPAAVVGIPIAWFYPHTILIFFFASQANELHGWSHQRCSSFVRMLQETELLASVKHHAQHHVDPFSRKYCVMSGWLNPVLDYFRLWAGLEYLILKTTGYRPRHSYFRGR